MRPCGTVALGFRIILPRAKGILPGVLTSPFLTGFSRTYLICFPGFPRVEAHEPAENLRLVGLE